VRAGRGRGRGKGKQRRARRGGWDDKSPQKTKRSSPARAGGGKRTVERAGPCFPAASHCFCRKGFISLRMGRVKKGERGGVRHVTLPALGCPAQGSGLGYARARPHGCIIFIRKVGHICDWHFKLIQLHPPLPLSTKESADRDPEQGRENLGEEGEECDRLDACGHSRHKHYYRVNPHAIAINGRACIPSIICFHAQRTKSVSNACKSSIDAIVYNSDLDFIRRSSINTTIASSSRSAESAQFVPLRANFPSQSQPSKCASASAISKARIYHMAGAIHEREKEKERTQMLELRLRCGRAHFVVPPAAKVTQRRSKESNMLRDYLMYMRWKGEL
jgi:hypothetical protein